MLRGPDNQTRSDKAACGLIARGWLSGPAPLALFMVCAVALCALIPVGIEIDKTAPRLNVYKCEAHAEGDLYTGIIEKMAESAGLTAGDFVATVAGSVSVATGMIIATDTGVQLGNSLSRNLGNLIDTADYPDWNNLSSEQQAIYGSKEQYDAAKFNSLMAAVSLDGVVNGWYSSGGSTFDPDENALQRLQQIGRIGINWGEGLYNTFSSIGGSSGIVDADKAKAWASVNQYQYDSDGVVDWPQYWPRYVTYGVGTTGMIVAKISAYNTYYYIANCSAPVGILAYTFTKTNGGVDKGFMLFSKASFMFGYDNGPNNTMPAITESPREYTSTVNGEKFYMAARATSGQFELISSNPGLNYLSGQPAGSSYQVVADTLLYGSGYNTPYATPIINYPGNDGSGEGGSGEGGSGESGNTIADDTPIYMPDDGVKPGQTWDDYTNPSGDSPEQPETPADRPENPYNPLDPDNPQNTSGTPEWKQETTENVMPLLNVNMERLFPFCLVYDLRLLWAKFNDLVMQGEGVGLSGQSVPNYVQLSFPVDLTVQSMGIDYHTTLDLDLQPLYDLLVSTRIYVFYMLIILTLTSIIAFWKRILTGG